MAYHQNYTQAADGRQLTPDAITREAYGERTYMKGLNDKLAAYIETVRGTRLESARSLPRQYMETMERVENDLIRLKNAYETEVEHTRSELQASNQRVISLNRALETEKMKHQELLKRVMANSSDSQRLRQSLDILRLGLSDREANVITLKDDLQVKEHEVAKLLSKNNELMKDNEQLIDRLEGEKSKYLELEETTTQLAERLRFERDINKTTVEDLQDRLRAANDIIKMMDTKTREITKMNKLPDLLQRLRDMNINDLEKYHKDTEASLNKTVASLQKQREEDMKTYSKLQTENQQLREYIRTLEGQVQGNYDNATAIKKDLQNERQQYEQQINELHKRLNQLQDQLLLKVKEFQNAREAQAALNSEIQTYRELLEHENHRLENRSVQGPSTPQRLPVPTPRPAPTPRQALPPISQGQLMPSWETKWDRFGTTYRTSYTPKKLSSLYN